MRNELCPERQNLLSHLKMFQTGDNKQTYLRLNVNYKTPFLSSYYRDSVSSILNLLG